jgi:hypothetical protein
LNFHWTSKDESQLIGEGARKGFPFSPIGQGKRFTFGRKEGPLKGLEILGLTHSIFSIRIWDVFGVRKEV